MRPVKGLWSPEQRALNEKLAGLEPFTDPYQVTNGKRCPTCREPTARPKNICINEYCRRFGERAGVNWRIPEHAMEGMLAFMIMMSALFLPTLMTIGLICAFVGMIVAWEL